MNKQIVVVTGASAGIGRAVATAFGARGATVGAASPVARTASTARPGTSSGAAARPSQLPHRRRRPRPGVRRGRADGVRGSARSTSGSTSPSPRCSRRSTRSRPQEFRRVTEVTYLGYVYATMAVLPRMKAARPGHDRAGRLGAGLPGHPAADRLLRGQARHPGLPRGAALRAAAREEQRPRDDGADAGGEHPAVLLGAVPAAAPSAAGAADLPARGCGPRRRLRRRPPAPPRVLGGRDHRGHPDRQRASPPACSTATSAGPDSSPSRPTSRTTRTQPDNLWQPADGAAAATTARTANSTRSRAPGIRSCGRPGTTARSLPPSPGSSRRSSAFGSAGRWPGRPPPPGRSPSPPQPIAPTMTGTDPAHPEEWPCQIRQSQIRHGPIRRPSAPSCGPRRPRSNRTPTSPRRRT